MQIIKKRLWNKDALRICLSSLQRERTFQSTGENLVGFTWVIIQFGWHLIVQFLPLELSPNATGSCSRTIILEHTILTSPLLTVRFPSKSTHRTTSKRVALLLMLRAQKQRIFLIKNEFRCLYLLFITNKNNKYLSIKVNCF